MERSHTLRAALLGVILILAAAPALAENADADAVPHVRNGAEPRDGVETLQLEELWRVGGFDDEDNIFGLITRVLSDPEGNVYLLDTQLMQVQVFTPDGEFSHTLSREGEGPGEVRFPVDMLFMPDGTLGLVQPFPGQIVCIDLEDNPADTFKPGDDDPTQGGFLSLTDVQSAGGHLVLGGLLSTINQQEGYQIRDHFIRRYELDGTLKHVVLHAARKFEFSHLDFDEADQYFPQFRKWALAEDGRIFVAAERDAYAINVYGPDGTLERVIEREAEPWTRTEEETAFVNAMLDAQLRQVPFPVERSIAETEEVINSLSLRPDGELWVLTGRGLRDHPEDVLSVYDVFDTEGVFVRRVQVPIEGESLQDGLFFAGDDRLILVKGFTDALTSLQTQGAGPSLSGDEEPAPMEIICYALR